MRRLAVFAVLCFLALPSLASAQTYVGIFGDGVHVPFRIGVVGDDGPNDIAASLSGIDPARPWRLSDPGGLEFDGDLCIAQSLSTALCPGDDELPWQVLGQSGNDYISVDRPDRSTEINGGPGDDTLAGGGESDVFDAYSGHDTIDGGGGTDLVNVPAGSTVDLATGHGVTPDGTFDIRNVENVRVDHGFGVTPSHITGSPAPNSIYMSAGTVSAGAGNDVIRTRIATIRCGSGFDTVTRIDSGATIGDDCERLQPNVAYGTALLDPRPRLVRGPKGRRSLRMRVFCANDPRVRCTGVLTVRLRGGLSRVHYSVKAGGRTWRPLSLPRGIRARVGDGVVVRSTVETPTERSVTHWTTRLVG